MKRITTFLALCLLAQALSASVDSLSPGVVSGADDPQIQAIDRMLVSAYLNHYCFSRDQSTMNAFRYEEGIVPAFSPALIAERMRVLDQETPFDLIYNPTVQGFIDLYAARKRELTSRVLGVSELYFPLFEEALSRHGIPLEMKYLAVVESALNPVAISPAGAGGLWQFMVATGKMYGLGVTSYQDDRFDAIKSTEAACLYLKHLYSLYNDWELALAAYNSGPGNVNKAIRRSGGKKDFWSIKEYLPRETQGYVPAFIAVNYVMNYASEYNLYPKTPLITFFETDTVEVRERVDFRVLSSVLSMKEEDLSFLNGTYKLKEIPANGRKHYLVLPVDKVGLFISNESLVYERSAMPAAAYALPDSQATASSGSAAQQASHPAGTPRVVYEEEWKTHKVKRGETLGGIADSYHVSLAQIKKWNKIRGSVIHPGQRLKVQRKVSKIVYDAPAEPTAEAQTEPAAQEGTDACEETQREEPRADEKKVSSPPRYTYYTIQPGDTLYKIASRHEGVTVDDIKTLNSGLREHKLVVGQKIKVRQIG
ncbi:MAG: LysM peptidoglycan-binding domain-containing protein [Flavobacteriales bacterium]